MKKYEFTGETKVVNGVTLNRIRAVRDFNHIKAGDLGGWIEGEVNLSHRGLSWVANDAQVTGGAKVFENAFVFGDARVGGHVHLSGSCLVGNGAEISGNALISGCAEVVGAVKVGGATVVSGFKKLK
jgi:UDP-3-O-[3-hydroxymyristoyl] glucosamine N-acyltransferase